VVFALLIRHILSSSIGPSSAGPARAPMLEASSVPVASCTRVFERDDDVVEGSGRNLVITSRAAVDLHRLVRLNRTNFGHVAGQWVLNEGTAAARARRAWRFGHLSIIGVVGAFCRARSMSRATTR
jgi:hypothetical protein